MTKKQMILVKNEIKKNNKIIIIKNANKLGINSRHI